jgi:MFS transporter, AAHS family, 3-hydroxyphenylpropionic acid transporter
MKIKGFATIALCFITALLEGLDLQSVGVAAPGIAGEFKLAPAMLGWMFSAGLAGLLPGALVGGWLADRIGRKTVLIWAVVLFGLFSLGTAHTWDFSSLLVARFVTGLGLGAALPILIAMTSEAADPAMRSTAVSLTYCGVPLGGAIAAIIGTMKFDGGWRVIFYVGGAAPIVVALLLALLLRESAAFRQQAGASNRQPALSGLFNDGLWRPTMLLWVACFFTLTVLYMLLNWLPSLLIGQGYSKPQAGMVQLLFNLGGAAGSVLTGWLIDRAGARRVVPVVYAGILLSLAGLGWAGSFALTLAAGFAAGCFVLGAQLILYARAPALYPTLIRATGVGASVAVGRLGAVAGPLAAGQLLAAGLGATGVMAGAAPGLLVAAVCAMRLARSADDAGSTAPASSGVPLPRSTG